MSAETSTDRREFLKESGTWILLTGAATLAWDFVVEGAPEQAPNYRASDHWWGMIIDIEKCIGCGNCQRNCPYDVIRMDSRPPDKPDLISWLLFGIGPGPGEPDEAWRAKNKPKGAEPPKVAIKCDMCIGKAGGPACVRACPTGAAIRVSPEEFLTVKRMNRGE